MMPTVEHLIDLIRAELLIDFELAPATPLLSSGLVDSFGIVVLLGVIEDEYEVVIDESVIAIETFDTPERILEQIQSAQRVG